MRRSKTQAQKDHFKRRARQRLGVNLTTAQVKQIIQRIHNQDFLSAERDSNRTTKFKMIIQDTLCMVVYDKTRKMVVTLWEVKKGNTVNDSSGDSPNSESRSSSGLAFLGDLQ